ncbi:MAG: AEC family transporter [Patescibacteria group bacterium]
MSMLTIILQLYIIIALGIIIDKIFKLDNKILTYIGLYLCLPALGFYGVYHGQYNWQTVVIPAIYVLLNCVMIVIAYVYAKLFRYNFKEQGVITALAWAGNNGNFGIPVILFLLGEKALAVTTLLILVNTIFLSGPGAYFLGREPNSLKQSILKVIKLPLIYAVLVGLLLNINHVFLPDAILQPIKTLGDALVPIQLILLGTFLARVKFTQIHWKLVSPTLIFKLIIMPALGYVFLVLFTVPLDQNAYVLLIEAATPFAVTTVTLADLYQNNPKQVAMANALSLALAPITLSILWWFIN